MEERVSATELARKLGDVLGRVRYRGDTFVVERNGHPVARIAPVVPPRVTTLEDTLSAWGTAGDRDASFADDLERIGASDRPPEHPWRR
jgi:prevent-host-death family protein